MRDRTRFFPIKLRSFVEWSNDAVWLQMRFYPISSSIQNVFLDVFSYTTHKQTSHDEEPWISFLEINFIFFILYNFRLFYVTHFCQRIVIFYIGRVVVVSCALRSEFLLCADLSGGKTQCANNTFLFRSYFCGHPHRPYLNTFSAKSKKRKKSIVCVSALAKNIEIYRQFLIKYWKSVTGITEHDWGTWIRSIGAAWSTVEKLANKIRDEQSYGWRYCEIFPEIGTAILHHRSNGWIFRIR